ncbi:MAG: glycoside hydrolase family 3 N-terminal domain-containing protein [Desulfobulbaceae bacterium]|nr:glycoside hydrolase family 3 N-terminal domain-containing protein [Desulfobulbaceae bacterium]
MIDSRLATHPGHLLMIGLPGCELDASTLDLIRQEGIHNFILFRRNVRDRKQLTDLCTALRESCLEQGLPRPLIAIDQEGGQVARLPPPFSIFPEPRQVAAGADCRPLLHQYATICATELVEVGINMNLAPVLDVCPTGQGLFMERRCLGDDPQLVAELGVIVINGLQGCGVAACAKHFPGLGAAMLDPHLELPVVDLSEERIVSNEMEPFRLAFAKKVASVMTSHALYANLDPELPGTLSGKVVHDLLRQRCAYDGLIVTDDMEMGAIGNFMEFPEAVVKAFQAGADLVLICQDHTKIRRALPALRDALRSGLIENARCQDSLRRQAEILRWAAI